MGAAGRVRKLDATGEGTTDPGARRVAVGRRVAAAFPVIASLVVSCAASPDPERTRVLADGPSGAGPISDLERFEPGECPVGKPDGVEGTLECGTVLVPRRRGPSGDAVRDAGAVGLPVVVLRRPAGPDAAAPVVFLHGGPGGRLFPARDGGQGVSGAWVLGELAHLAPRSDLVLFEQRGVTDAVDPDACAATLGAVLEPDPDAVTARALACVRAWERATGHVVDEMRPEEYTGDVESVRRALGIERWTLYGSSYGGRVAAELVRTVSETVHAAVLDSPVVPGRRVGEAVAAPMVAALDSAFAACEDDPGCAAAWPRLREDFPVAVRTLDDAPVALDYSPPARLGAGPVIDVDGAVFVAATAAMLGVAPGVLPKLVDAAARRDASFLARMLGARDPASGRFPAAVPDGAPVLEATTDIASPAVGIAYACNERPADALDPPTDRGLARSVLDALPVPEATDATCAALGTAALARVDAPADGAREVPVLALVGALDVLANRGDAAAIERELPAARTVTFSRAGHVPGMTDGCARALAADFLEAPASVMGWKRVPLCTEEPPVFARDGAETWRDERVPGSGTVLGVPEGWTVVTPGSLWTRYPGDENLLWQSVSAGTPASALEATASWLRANGTPYGSRAPVARRRLDARTVRGDEWQLYELTHDNGRLVRAGVAAVGARVAIVAAMADADGPNAARLAPIVDAAIDRFRHD